MFLQSIKFLIHCLHGQFLFHANPADEWSSADMAGVVKGGIIHEDVMNKIWDISRIPLPFTDRIGTDPVSNAAPTWTQDNLDAPDLTNKVIDGLDNVKQNARGGKRVGNQCQIMTKAVSVTTRARNVDMIGAGDALSYNVMMRQRELRRDAEAIMLNNQASLADDGDAVAGSLGGLPSWLETNVVIGTLGTVGGYDTTTGLTVAYIDGTALPITESDIRDIAQQIYQEGGEASVLMTVPQGIRLISEYMFTDGARIATLESDQNKSRDKAAALGSVNLFITDFGSLELVPNRIQQPSDTDEAHVFILDMSLIRQGMLHGYRTEPLAKTGLADKRQMAVDCTLKVLQETGLGMLAERFTNVPMLSVPA